MVSLSGCCREVSSASTVYWKNRQVYYVRGLVKVGNEGSPTLVNRGGNGCTPSRPCQACNGDCDRDSDCAGDLKCFQRSGFTAVPRCSTARVRGNVGGYDYCYKRNGAGYLKVGFQRTNGGPKYMPIPISIFTTDIEGLGALQPCMPVDPGGSVFVWLPPAAPVRLAS